MSHPSITSSSGIQDLTIAILSAFVVSEIKYFTGCTVQPVKALEKAGLLSIESEEVYRHKVSFDGELHPLPMLTDAQQKTIQDMPNKLILPAALTVIDEEAFAGGTFTCVAVKAPSFGEKRKDMLRDIAILTGGQVITSDLGLELKDTQITDLGRARQVKVTKEHTIIVDGAGDSDAIRDRVAQIRAELETTTSSFDREKLQERLAKLAGGVAVIKVGAATEIEMKEKKLRIEDALNATRAAVEEGIVPGGGTAYLNVIADVKALLDSVEGDEKTGVSIILKSLEAPVRQIAANAGFDGGVIVDKIVTSGKIGWGFDAYNETYCDMVSAGIVDPTKVTRSALQNAASIASTILTTEAVVANQKEDPAAVAAANAAMNAGGGIVNPKDRLALARHEIACSLDDVVKAAKDVLKPCGKLFMVHRADRMCDVITTMRKYKIEPKRMRIVYPSENKAASLILVEGAEGGKPQLKMESAVFMYDNEGNYLQSLEKGQLL